MFGVLKQLFALDSQKNTNSFVHQFITHTAGVSQKHKSYDWIILQFSAQIRESDVQKYVWINLEL